MKQGIYYKHNAPTALRAPLGAACLFTRSSYPQAPSERNVYSLMARLLDQPPRRS